MGLGPLDQMPEMVAAFVFEHFIVLRLIRRIGAVSQFLARCTVSALRFWPRRNVMILWVQIHSAQGLQLERDVPVEPVVFHSSKFIVRVITVAGCPCLSRKYGNLRLWLISC